jgi:hypothetical protein
MATVNKRFGLPNTAGLRTRLHRGRGILEMALLPALYPLLCNTPHGDWTPCRCWCRALLPGDATLSASRPSCVRAATTSRPGGLGQNTGFKLKFSQALEQKVRFMHHRHRRKVSLVGLEPRRVYAFYAAHAAPECVRSVVSLGSPIEVLDRRAARVPVVVKAAYRYFAHPMGPVAHLANVRARSAVRRQPVPSTCVFSLTATDRAARCRAHRRQDAMT